MARRVAGKPAARATTEDRAIRLLLGLDALDPPVSWPSQTDIAHAIDRSRAQISQIVGKKRDTWRKD
ncbi:MAG: hypothetical protein NTV94_10415, partial [Planctomycetota bacterium]|nr:hypothetical protein [Planctomycetota bacterium]